jgi:hypothetical protein
MAKVQGKIQKWLLLGSECAAVAPIVLNGAPISAKTLRMVLELAPMVLELSRMVRKFAQIQIASFA